MKERFTMQRLMLEGWIPVLTGILSASVIVSLAHSTGMAYVTALLLLTLYFVAIAANRVNAKAILIQLGKRILQQAIQKIGEILHIDELEGLLRNILSLWSVPIDLTKDRLEQSIAALTKRFADFVGCVKSLRLSSPIIGWASKLESAEMTEWLKERKFTIGKLVQSLKSAV